MEAVHLIGAVSALLLTLGIGTVAHELTHATVLRALGIPYELEWFPRHNGKATLNTGVLGVWATVTPQSLSEDVPTWGLQLSALAPLMLTLPVLLMFAGLLPDPLESGSIPYVVVTITWLGCAIPSPQDFSLFWHADQVIDEYAE